MSRVARHHWRGVARAGELVSNFSEAVRESLRSAPGAPLSAEAAHRAGDNERGVHRSGLRCGKNKKPIHKPGPGSCEPLASTALVRKHHISELLQSLLFLSSPGTACKAGN